MTSEAILRRHLMTQHDVTPESGQGSSCPICNTFKGNAKEIERHLENVHKLLLEEDKFTSETLEGKFSTMINEIMLLVLAYH